MIHLLGIFLVLLALGGATALSGTSSGTRASQPGKTWVAVTHGVGLLVVLVSGFGLLAGLGISHGGSWPIWVWIKLGIWLVLGGMTALIAKKPRSARLYWMLIPILAAVAAYLAVNKPF